MVAMNKKLYLVWVMAIFAAMYSIGTAEVILPLDSDIYDYGSNEATFWEAPDGDSNAPAGWSSVGSVPIRIYKGNSTGNAALIAGVGYYAQDYTAQFVTSTPAVANKEYSLSMLIGAFADDTKDCKVTVTFGTVNGSGVFTAFGLPNGPRLIDLTGSTTNLSGWYGVYTTFKTISETTVPDGNVAVQIYVDSLGAYWPGFDSLLLEKNDDNTGIIISTPPQPVTVNVGQTAVFTIRGHNINSYLWYKGTTALSNGGNISGADTNTLTITNVQPSDDDMYYCHVGNGAASADSQAAMLMTKKLAIHLKFDSNVIDSSGLGNNGTAVGTVAYGVGADGVANSALQLSNTSGTSNYVRVINPVSSLSSSIDTSSKDIIANTKSFTISCWIKPSFVQSYEMYVSTACPGNGWYLSREAGSTTQARFNTFDTSVALISTTDPLNEGNWHLITAVVDSDAGKDYLYLDGIKQGEGVANPNPGYDFLVGALNWVKYPSLSVDLGYTGLIDDVRYYNYALEADDLYELYYEMTGVPICLGGAGTGDLNADCKVDFTDLALMSEGWLNCSLYPASACD